MSATTSPSTSPENSPRPQVEVPVEVPLSPKLTALKALSEWDTFGDFSPSDYHAVVNLPSNVVDMIHLSNQAGLKSLAEYEASQGKRDTAWVDKRTELQTAYDKKNLDRLRDLLGQGRVGVSLKSEKSKVQIPVGWLGFLVQALETEHKSVMTSLSPPKIKKGSGRKDNTNWVDKFANKPEDAKVEEFRFVGDENATICKITSASKDGTTRTKTYKSVSSNRYLGGSESEVGDGFCEGAVIWDKATGSNALKRVGMSASQFRIRCGKKSDGGLCKDCQSGKSNPNFFTGKYSISRGKGKEYDGDTFKDFMVERMKYE